jgi:hypothetical protein
LNLPAVITGATIMGYAVAAVFFLKFWRRTSDGLFLAFAGAFVLLGAGPLLMTVLEVPREEQSPFFLLRLTAFLIIIAAVIGKSKSRTRL